MCANNSTTMKDRINKTKWFAGSSWELWFCPSVQEKAHENPKKEIIQSTLYLLLRRVHNDINQQLWMEKTDCL